LQEVDDLRVCDATGQYVLATWRRVMVVIWKGVATAEGIERSRQVMDVWARRHKEGVMVLVVMPAALPRPPSEEARAAMLRATQGAKANLKGIAMVYGGSGFVLAAIRGVTAARSLIDRSRIPTRIFANVAEAAPWISQCVGPDHTANGLVEAVDRAARA